MSGDAPHVVGVVTADGEEVRADLVIDAMGRRSKMADWLAAAGGRAPATESEDSGFVYWTRYFAGPQLPPQRSGPLTPLGSISMLTLPGDNGTWSVTIFGASADKDLKPLRRVEAFTRVVAAHPLHAQWLEGEPLGDIEVMGGILDKIRDYVVDGQPVATGVLPVGDAWACTNPSAGRGISVGTVQAQCLRDATREVALSDPVGLVHRFHELTERRAAPFFHNQIAFDRFRIREMAAHRDGTEPPEPEPFATAVGTAAGRDPDVFRAVVAANMCLGLPQDLFSAPGFTEKVHAAAADGPPPSPPRPSRAELVELASS